MSVSMQPLLQYFKAILNPGPGVALFALRTIVAGLLTLYLAFLFDLEQPKWSIMAVVIVSQPLGWRNGYRCGYRSTPITRPKTDCVPGQPPP